MKPILIYKGDDTIFADLRRFLTFNIETNLDLTGWKAKFTLGWITKEINDISSKSFEIILSSDETKNLRLGSQSGSIVLTDSIGHIKTITNSIPFEVTTQVVENEYQEIDLTIPESSGVDIKLKVGAEVVTSVNGMTGDVYLDIPSIEGLATEQQLQQGLNTKQDKGDYATNSRVNEVEGLIPDISNLATKQELQEGLDTKQPTGDYALKSEIPTKVSSFTNDANYQTATDVASMIASIPQFSLSIVDSLPSSGQKMVLYLVPKTSAGGDDIYDEYIWIESTSSFELVGSTTVDLSDYYSKTETNKLLDDCVHKTGAETVEGDKTFISPQGMVIKRTTVSGPILKLVSSYYSTNFILERTDGAKCVLESGDTLGLFGTQTNHPLQIRTNYKNRITIGTDGSVILVTDVSSSSNSNQVATTKWVNNKLSNTETWTFTLEDGTEVTKTMVLGA